MPDCARGKKARFDAYFEIVISQSSIPLSTLSSTLPNGMVHVWLCSEVPKPRLADSKLSMILLPGPVFRGRPFTSWVTRPFNHSRNARSIAVEPHLPPVGRFYGQVEVLVVFRGVTTRTLNCLPYTQTGCYFAHSICCKVLVDCYYLGITPQS